MPLSRLGQVIFGLSCQTVRALGIIKGYAHRHRDLPSLLSQDRQGSRGSRYRAFTSGVRACRLCVALAGIRGHAPGVAS